MSKFSDRRKLNPDVKQGLNLPLLDAHIPRKPSNVINRLGSDMILQYKNRLIEEVIAIGITKTSPSSAEP